ncbi:hypothetical protein TPL01_25610 [Sulfuriferula plumbiphila]|uniref:Uncharacterized protein n=1 Tax=Sulfuriferula plumbiphila TaxID=171865 RepID=A0A512LAB0_9PROT|nr:hypothetical protein [Sulfuriferula plumbiphila]BBP03123.1 hypothetical protein SFPGR_05450 [Sulfuriferula plumbiphila]GEP31423.1 hypothetical protein TPL01_25610 [Sulfuriferula plumbiphila]
MEAAGRVRRASDIDLAIEAPVLAPARWRDLIEALEQTPIYLQAGRHPSGYTGRPGTQAGHRAQPDAALNLVQKPGVAKKQHNRTKVTQIRCKDCSA